LAGWFTKFGQVASAYDANGHYARIQPIFGLFDYDEDTGELTRKPDSQRIDGFGSSQQQRCPGAAVQPPPDGSAPYPVDECDPDQTPPGG
jgi:phospholipid/cholesterol/gamma-HCH transport system substrate-binding protein